MKFAIECNSCSREYALELSDSNTIQIIAAVCDCGTIIAGNYKRMVENVNSKNNFYTNGSFRVTEKNPDLLPNLKLE